MRRRLNLLVTSLIVLLAACGGQNSVEPLPQLELAGHTMGTTYSVKVVSSQDSMAQALKIELDKALVNINQAMSTYIDDSELSSFNRSETNQWYSASPMLLDVLQAARGVFVLSEGSFDPSIGPLVNLWGFGPEMKLELPEPDQISQAKRRVGFNYLDIDAARGQLRKSRDLYVDLSAIAKGYAVDRLADIIESKGFEHYLVEIGGELKSSGLNAERQPWRIAIEKPQAGVRLVHGVINVSDMGMATSGDYRNFFEKNGRRYSHTIDPRTGYPVEHSLVSVTVLANDCMRADALATAFMVMGVETGYELAEKQGMAVWFIEQKEGKLVDKLTPKMQSYRLH